MTRDIRVLADNISFGECPRWHDGRLWFSDFFAHAVKSVSPSGDLLTEFEMDDQPAGLGWMPDGSMLIVSTEKRQVLRRSQNGAVNLHADLAHTGFRCNDMVVDASGAAFVGDFGFNLHGEVLQRGLESVIQDHPTASITRVAPDGSIKTVAKDMHFPNGSVITADGRTLIVGETLTGVLTAFEITNDGSLVNRRVWAKIWPRVPDGIALNADGCMWAANPLAQECVLVQEGGEIVDVIVTGEPCYACMLGGGDGRTLFMLTAPTFFQPAAHLAHPGKLLVTTVASPRAGSP